MISAATAVFLHTHLYACCVHLVCVHVCVHADCFIVEVTHLQCQMHFQMYNIERSAVVQHSLTHSLFQRAWIAVGILLSTHERKNRGDCIHLLRLQGVSTELLISNKTGDATKATHERENGVQREEKSGEETKRRNESNGTMLGAIAVDLSFDFIPLVHLVCSGWFRNFVIDVCKQQQEQHHQTESMLFAHTAPNHLLYRTS